MLSVPTVTSHGKTMLGGTTAPPRPAANRLKAPETADRWGHFNSVIAQSAPYQPAQPDTSDAYACLSAALSEISELGQKVRRPVSDLSTSALATLLVGKDETAALSFCRRYLTPHTGRSELTDLLLAPAIRLLGTRWEQNALCFSDMTVAAARAQLISRSWGTGERAGLCAEPLQSALFASLSRQRHMLGMILAAHAFRDHGGWDVDLLLNASGAEVVRRARIMRPRVVGFTVGERKDVQEVSRTISDLRALPFQLKIIVGGNAATLLKEHCNQFFVDAIVPDIASALAVAN